MILHPVNLVLINSYSQILELLMLEVTIKRHVSWLTSRLGNIFAKRRTVGKKMSLGTEAGLTAVEDPV